MKRIHNFAKKLYLAGYHQLSAKLTEANEDHNRRVLEEWNKTKEGDVYEQLMNEIPTIPENETLDEQVEREMKMESELGSESDLDVVMRALQKKLKSKSTNLSDLLDEVEKAKAKQPKEEPEERILHAQEYAQERRYKVSVLYPSVDSEGQPYFTEDGVSEDLSITAGELDGLKQEENLGYLKVLDVKPKLPVEG